ncbi:MAG: hypothetical protein V1913_18545, partial [Fibrobacterota bacterium]
IGEGTFNSLGYFTTMNKRIGLYTNFINGQGGNECLLGNSSNDKYFLGTSGNLVRLVEKLNTSVFVELNNATSSGLLASKINATTGTGYLSQNVSAYDAVSGITETQTEENRSERVVKMNSWMLNNTFALSDRLTAGLLLSYQGANLDDTRSPFATVNATQGNFLPVVNAPDFTYTYGNGLTSRNTRGEYTVTGESPVTRVNLGARLGLSLLTVDGYFGLNYMPGTGDSTTNYNYNENSQTVALSESETQTAKGEYNLKLFTLGTRLSKSFLDNRLKTSGTFQLGFGTGAQDYSKAIAYNLRDVAHGALFSTTNTTAISEGYSYTDGDRSAFNTGMCLNAYFTIEDNLNLGFGFGYRTFNSSTVYTLKHTQSRVDTYNDGDNQTADPDDYTRTTAYVYNDSKDSAALRTGIIDLPVGFTWDVTSKWQVRAGALHQILQSHDVVQVLESGGDAIVTTTRYNDGAVTTVNATANPQTAVSSMRGRPSNTLASSTTFTYGVGFTPLKNLNLDLKGFFTTGATQVVLDEAWYQNLYLSLTFFFDPVKTPESPAAVEPAKN